MTITTKVKEMLDYITEECTPIDREQRFRDMLDECYSFDNVGGPFSSFLPSRVLEKMDPVAFRCGVNDYIDGEDTYEIGSETYDQREVDESREQFIHNLTCELDDMEDGLDVGEGAADIDKRIEEYKQWIKECKNYVL